MSMLFKRFKDWATTITDFRTGDVIPVDGPSGTAKMSKDDLLRETAENAVAGNVAPVFDSSASYKAGQSVVYRGRLYTFKNDHTGAWVANDATATSVNDTFGKPVNISGVNKDFSAGVDILQDKLYKGSLGFYTTNGLQSHISHKYYEIDPSQVDTIYFELSALNVVQNPHMVVLDSNGVYHGFGNTKTQQTYTFSASDCKDYIAGARIFVNAYTITTKLIVKCSDIHKAIEPTIDDIKTSISTLYTKVEGLQKTVYTSLSQTLTPSLSMLVNFPPALVDGHYHYVGNFSNLETPAWIFFGLHISESWKKGHDYFVAIDLEVVEDSRTAGGNFYAELIAKKAINQTVSTQQLTKTGVVNGTRGNLLGVIHITDDIDTYTGADNFIVQCGKYDNTGSLELNLYNALVFDMGVSGEEGYITYEDAEKLFATYGYQNVVKVIENAYHATIAEMAKGVQNMDVSGDIDLWGDSLVAQGYGSIIGTLLDRTVYSHGFGGKNSGYIRDQFLAYQSKSNAIIINIGRNDAATNNADKVFQNIAAMVAAIPHQNYLICCPPNGKYAGEGYGGIVYQTFFERLEDRLAKAYGANFLNTREGTIYSYDMGNVKLTEGFTKPAVGSSVTVKVSDAAFLTTYNAADVAAFGQAEAEKVAIGHTIDAVDIYSVTSYDNENNTLTLTLLTDGSDVAVGGTFDNVTTGGAVYYARVMQYLDYLCWKQDRTESTFRADGIHMSDAGKNCLAQVIARKVSAMKI